jgi:hypothetical protein
LYKALDVAGIYHIVGTNIANSSVGEYYHGYDRKRNGKKDLKWERG